MSQNNMNLARLRPSFLPNYQDCARRAAAQQWRFEIQERGFEIRDLLPSVGAAVGSAAHKAIAQALEIKKESGVMVEYQDMVPIAAEEFNALTEGGVEFDSTSTNALHAKQQISGIIQEFAATALVNVQPVAVENKLECQHPAGGWSLDGTYDCKDINGAIYDWKTSIRNRIYQSQLGAYGILERAVGREVTALKVGWIKRTAFTKPQADIKVYEYDLVDSINLAFSVANRAAKDYFNFMATGDPDSFMSSPDSMMCTKRYCPVFGTEFCNQWKNKE